MAHFHDKSGEGYSFIGDCIIELDALNPQVAARLAGKSLYSFGTVTCNVRLEERSVDEAVVKSLPLLVLFIPRSLQC